VEPLGNVLHALRRPETYTGHLKEVSSTLITAGMWPFGFGGAGSAGLHHLPETSPVETPVLLVHGYGANKSNWIVLRRHLQGAGFHRLDALNYNPLSTDIPGLAARLVERAEALREHTGSDRLHLVGHSLGGIIARYAVQVLGLRGVGVCITVASPHGGVRVARYGSPLSQISPLASGLQLRPDSEIMTLLRATARPLPTRFVAYYSNLDVIVAARRAMILEPELDATNVLVKDQGHLSIMLSRRLASSVVDQLGAAEGLPGHGSALRSLAAQRQREPGAGRAQHDGGGDRDRGPRRREA
jgi:pimeloyl-ACP methyl ester carboxylesterase